MPLCAWSYYRHFKNCLEPKLARLTAVTFLSCLKELCARRLRNSFVSGRWLVLVRYSVATKPIKAIGIAC